MREKEVPELKIRKGADEEFVKEYAEEAAETKVDVEEVVDEEVAEEVISDLLVYVVSELCVILLTFSLIFLLKL